MDSESSELQHLTDAIEGLNEILPDDKKGLIDKIVESIFDSVSVTTIVSDPIRPEYKIAPPFNAAVVQWTKDNWKPRSGDVIVASFPKTGTTWTREIVRRILYKDNEEKYKISKLCELPFFGYLEAASAVKYELVDELELERRVWGTHLVTDLLNMENILESGAKIIYIMRNPKDTVVSLKKFLENMPFMKHPEIKKFFPDDMDAYVKAFVEGKLPVFMKEGEWYPHHILSWWKYKNNPNVHFVFYENMKKNPEAEVQLISKHIGVTLTKEEVAGIVEKTSFNAMKKAANKGLTRVEMFRKGGIGNWKEHLTEEMSKLVETEMTKQIGNLPIDFVYSS